MHYTLILVCSDRFQFAYKIVKCCLLTVPSSHLLHSLVFVQNSIAFCIMVFDRFFFITGWGEPYGGPQKIESSTWSEHAAPPVTVDNGTSAWGKSVDKGSSWEESGRENSGGSSWGNPAIGQQSQHKSGTSHLQLWQITFFDLVSSCFVWLFQ